MFFTSASSNPFNGEKKDTKVILIDIAMIRSWPGTWELSEMRLWGGESEGGEGRRGEARAVLLLAVVRHMS